MIAMFICHFDELRRDKGVSVNQVATDTGLSYNTLQRLRSGPMERVYLATLETLMRYFDLDELTDLIEYIPNELIASLKKQKKKEATPPGETSSS